MAEPTDELADRLALRRLVEDYASAVDERDADAFASLFLPDALLVIYEADSDEPVVTYAGADELRSVMSLLDQYERTFHFVGNHRCDLDGDAATGETYCLAHHLRKTDDGEEDELMVIKYGDRYARTENGWRFERRDVLRQWTELRPAVKKPLSIS